MCSKISSCLQRYKNYKNWLKYFRVMITNVLPRFSNHSVLECYRALLIGVWWTVFYSIDMYYLPFKMCVHDTSSWDLINVSIALNMWNIIILLNFAFTHFNAHHSVESTVLMSIIINLFMIWQHYLGVGFWWPLWNISIFGLHIYSY